MNESFSESESFDAKKYAVLAWALGSTRAILYDVIAGKFQIEEVQKMLDQTSLDALAQKIGCEAADLAINWNEYL